MFKILISAIVLSLGLNAVDKFEINKDEFLIEYSLEKKGATKVIYNLDYRVNVGNLQKRPEFYKDDSLKYPYGTTPEDYTNTGFDRGHLAPDASFDYDVETLNKTYSMANIVPQYPDVNRKVWKDIEELERYNASQFGNLYVENIVEYNSNEILKKLPIEEILPERKFKNTEHRAKYISKYEKDSINLEKKEIYVPTHFIKKMENKEHGFRECYKVPNIKNINTNGIEQYKINCSNI